MSKNPLDNRLYICEAEPYLSGESRRKKMHDNKKAMSSSKLTHGGAQTGSVCHISLNKAHLKTCTRSVFCKEQ
jgi:hypothetical protein